MSNPVATPSTLVEAQNDYQMDLGLKQQYDAYLAAHPGAVEGGNNPLLVWHQASQDIEAALTAGGYGDAAEELAANDYAAAAAWFEAHPTLGATSSGGGPTGSPTIGGLTVLQPASGGSGWSGLGTAAESAVTSLVGAIGSLFSVVANPGQWLATLGGGTESAVSEVGAGVGQGLANVGTGLAGGLSGLLWPAAVIGGIVYLDRRARRRR